MESDEMKASIGAILGAADEPVTLAALAKGMGVTELAVEDALYEFEASLRAAKLGMQVRHRDGTVRLEVEPQYIDAVSLVLPKWSRKKLSKEASQTLVLIAYMEPVTVAQLSERRGTDCSAALQTLRNRGLIARKAQLGQRRQKVYQTTAHFLEVCGLQSLEEFFQEGTRQSLFPDLFSASAEEEEVEEAEELEEDEDDSESED